MSIETGTEYLEGPEAESFLQQESCEGCQKPAAEWAQADERGNVTVHGDYSSGGDVGGYLCKACFDVQGRR